MAISMLSLIVIAAAQNVDPLSALNHASALSVEKDVSIGDDEDVSDTISSASASATGSPTTTALVFPTSSIPTESPATRSLRGLSGPSVKEADAGQADAVAPVTEVAKGTKDAVLDGQKGNKAGPWWADLVARFKNRISKSKDNWADVGSRLQKGISDSF